MKRLRIVQKIPLLLFTLIIGCFDLPEEIIAPEWDVDINIPIMNKRYTLYDIFKPQSKYSITNVLNNEDFYLVTTDDFIANSQLTEVIEISDEDFITQSFILPANSPIQPIYITFPDSTEIENAIFMSGHLAYSIQNTSGEAMSFYLRIPGIHKPNGSELVIESIIPAFGRDSINYDLTDHRYFFPSGQPGQNKNSLQINLNAISPLNGVFANVNFYGYDFKFSSLTGILPRTGIGVERTSTFVNLDEAAEYRGKLFLRNAQLNLKSEYISSHQNHFDIEIFNIKIAGKRNNGEEIFLTKQNGQNINLQLINGISTVSLDESISNLTEFLSFFPDSIIIYSEYILNPLNKRIIKQITNLDSIRFSVQFNTKSIFAMKQTNYSDTIAIEISQDDRKRIQDVIDADLTIHLENAIPIDAFVKATIADENYSPLFTLTKNQAGVDSLQFHGSQVNINTGQIIAPTLTFNSIKLDSTQIVQFSNAQYIIISTTLNTVNAGNENPNPPTVQFKSSDWLNIKCFGKVKYHVRTGEK